MQPEFFLNMDTVLNVLTEMAKDGLATWWWDAFICSGKYLLSFILCAERVMYAEIRIDPSSWHLAWLAWTYNVKMKPQLGN